MTSTSDRVMRVAGECRRLVFDALDGGATGSGNALSKALDIAPRTAAKYLVEWERQRGAVRTTRLDSLGRRQPARKRWSTADAHAQDTSANAWVVYFIQDESGPIKIGRAFGSASARLTTLQTGNPRRLTLLATSADLNEGELHRRFAGSRIGGEWFAPTDELLDLVREIQ